MNLYTENHHQLLYNLLEQEVDFIIIGGYAVIYHGYARTTGDMDIWLKPDNANKMKLLNALTAMDFFETDLAPIADFDFTGHIVFSMWEEPEKIDFITQINLLTFEEANRRKIIADIEGLKVPFLHLDDLVRSKFNTGRLKDKADIEELQLIQRYKNI